MLLCLSLAIQKYLLSISNDTEHISRTLRKELFFKNKIEQSLHTLGLLGLIESKCGRGQRGLDQLLSSPVSFHTKIWSFDLFNNKVLYNRFRRTDRHLVWSASGDSYPSFYSSSRCILKGLYFRNYPHIPHSASHWTSRIQLRSPYSSSWKGKIVSIKKQK